MELRKLRIVYLPLSKLVSWNHQPKDRMKKGTPLLELRNSILATKLVVPLVVVSSPPDDRYYIYDGNRRYTILKDYLKLDVAPCIVLEEKDLGLEQSSFFGKINTSQHITAMDRQKIWLKERNEDIFTERQKIALHFFMKTVGIQTVDEIVENNYSIAGLYNIITRLLKHCNKSLVYENINILLNWIMDHKERPIKLNVGIKEGLFKPMWLWQQIKENRSITGKLK